MIGRRAVIWGSSLAALCVSSVARAQPATALPRIALVTQGRRVEGLVEGGDPNWDALLRELRALGHVEGESIGIDRWSTIDRDQSDEGIASLARAVVETQPVVIVATGVRLILALKQATLRIPIVGSGTFPGFNLARPGGNVTGIDTASGTEVYVKQMQLLRDAVQPATTIAWLGPRDSWDGPVGAAARTAAEQLGLTLFPLIVEYPVGDSAIRNAFLAVAGMDIGALFVSAATVMNPFPRTVAELALTAGLPAIGYYAEYSQAGLMMSYGPDFRDVFRRLAHYVDQILSGADPADMPIQQPTAFDFIINLKTAEALGITLPPLIMLRATEVIE